MSESTRLEKLRELHRRDPRDSFVAYGLAMELARSPATVKEALTAFQALATASPDYLPTYFQLGTLLARQGETAQAREVCEKGIAVAGRLGESHTRDELQAAMDAL